MVLTYIVCKIKRLIGRKSRNLFSAPQEVRDFVGISRRCLILIKHNDRATCGEETVTMIEPFPYNTGT